MIYFKFKSVLKNNKGKIGFRKIVTIAVTILASGLFLYLVVKTIGRFA